MKKSDVLDLFSEDAKPTCSQMKTMSEAVGGYGKVGPPRRNLRGPDLGQGVVGHGRPKNVEYGELETPEIDPQIFRKYHYLSEDEIKKAVMISKQSAMPDVDVILAIYSAMIGKGVTVDIRKPSLRPS